MSAKKRKAGRGTLWVNQYKHLHGDQQREEAAAQPDYYGNITLPCRPLAHTLTATLPTGERVVLPVGTKLENPPTVRVGVYEYYDPSTGFDVLHISSMYYVK